MPENKLDQISRQISNLTHQIENLSVSPNKSTVAEVLLSILPVVATSLGGVLCFFFLLWQYRLRKTLISSGQYTPNSLKNLRILSLLFGINGVLLGAPLTLVLFLVDGIRYSLLGGLIPFCLGLGMVIFYSIIRKQT